MQGHFEVALYAILLSGYDILYQALGPLFLSHEPWDGNPKW